MTSTLLFRRSDQSLLSRWWWTIDGGMLVCLIILMLFGIFLLDAVSSLMAERLALPSSYFIQYHLWFLIPTVGFLLLLSFLSPQDIQILSLCLFVGALGAVILTLIIGTDINGAQRWLRIGTLSVQPSEFLKPSLVVIIAWLFTHSALPGDKIAGVLIFFVLVLLLSQPDLGMGIIVVSIWFAQIFVAGIRFIWVWLFALLLILGVITAYLLFDHVQKRVDDFLNSQHTETSQIGRARTAYQNGAMLGIAPDQEQIGSKLPDAHTDFIFVIAAEKLGLVGCLSILLVFWFFIIRGLSHLFKESDLFILLTVSGLLVHIGLQVLVNVGSTVMLIPITGTTLPFISYGGSSLVANGIGAGIILALTRRRYDPTKVL